MGSDPEYAYWYWLGMSVYDPDGVRFCDSRWGCMVGYDPSTISKADGDGMRAVVGPGLTAGTAELS